MSRVTNSVLLRYGINTFWSSWRLSLNSVNSSLQLNVFFSLFLRNYFFRVLKIQYTRVNILIYVFYLREDKFSFLYKYLNLNKILINNLQKRKNYGFTINSKGSSNKVASIAFWLVNKVISLLYTAFWWLWRLSALKKKLIYINFLVPTNRLYRLALSKSRKRIVCKKLVKWKTRKKKVKFITCKKQVKLRLINHLIKYKTLGLTCSILIFYYTTRKYYIHFKSLTHKKQDIKLPFLFNLKKNLIAKQRLYVVLLSFMFLKSFVLNSYIAILIKEIKDKKHITVIKRLFESIKALFLQQFVPLLGIKFQIAGRLNGKLRKSRFGYNIGSIQLMSLSVFCDYSCDLAYTQYGSFSLKLWLCANT